MTAIILHAVPGLMLLCTAHFCWARSYDAARASGADYGEQMATNPDDRRAYRWATAAIIAAIGSGGLLGQAILIALHLGATA